MYCTQGRAGVEVVPFQMKAIIPALLLLALHAPGHSFAVHNVPARSETKDEAHLAQHIAHFELSNGTLIEGLAILSSDPSVELYIGLEEILRGKLSDLDRRVRFSLRLENQSVQKIVASLCTLDKRYTWSRDGASIDVYPRAKVDDASYLMNYVVGDLTLTAASDPDRVFAAIHIQFPNEQLAYVQFGGDINYSAPWTVTFREVTVRQLMNRMAEHLGPRNVWILHGSREEKLFTFERGGFHTAAPQY
jgi:hypothetical protein